jgi:catechol 2,3-dioxygenase-like lactoylglutathione lyase family enzyme
MMSRSDVFVRLHHVRVPVSDVIRSQDWYCDVLGFECRLCVEDEDRVVGVVLDHGSGLSLGLHLQPQAARALRGFCCLALDVGSTDDLARCCRTLDSAGIPHSAPAEGHLGWFVAIRDPDGIVIEFHTSSRPSADEA